MATAALMPSAAGGITSGDSLPGTMFAKSPLQSSCLGQMQSGGGILGGSIGLAGSPGSIGGPVMPSLGGPGSIAGPSSIGGLAMPPSGASSSPGNVGGLQMPVLGMSNGAPGSDSLGVATGGTVGFGGPSSVGGLAMPPLGASSNPGSVGGLQMPGLGMFGGLVASPRPPATPGASGAPGSIGGTSAFTPGSVGVMANSRAPGAAGGPGSIGSMPPSSLGGVPKKADSTLGPCQPCGAPGSLSSALAPAGRRSRAKSVTVDPEAEVIDDAEKRCPVDEGEGLQTFRPLASKPSSFKSVFINTDLMSQASSTAPSECTLPPVPKYTNPESWNMPGHLNNFVEGEEPRCEHDGMFLKRRVHRCGGGGYLSMGGGKKEVKCSICTVALVDGASYLTCTNQAHPVFAVCGKCQSMGMEQARVAFQHEKPECPEKSARCLTCFRGHDLQHIDLKLHQGFVHSRSCMACGRRIARGEPRHGCTAKECKKDCYNVCVDCVTSQDVVLNCSCALHVLQQRLKKGESVAVGGKLNSAAASSAQLGTRVSCLLLKEGETLADITEEGGDNE